MNTIKLHGWLGKKYGKTFKFAVNNPAQAISLLRANFKTFESDVVKFSGGYRVVVGKDTIALEELPMTCGTKTIHIIPVINGANDPVARIIVGAALMIAAPSGSSMWAKFMFAAGASLVIGGTMQMLSPVPKTPSFDSERADNKPSYSFNGAINTTGQGNPVPVLYGQLLVGSQVVSFGISTRQVSV